MPNSYDALIIGTGQAGPPLARRLAGAGMRVAIIERKLFGGTCVNTGCIPTKTMVASAYAARMVQRASEFGVDSGGSAKVAERAPAFSPATRTISPARRCGLALDGPIATISSSFRRK